MSALPEPAPSPRPSAGRRPALGAVPSRLRCCALAGALVLLAGCKVATQTDLRFDAGPMTRAHAVTMRVEVTGRAGEVALLVDRPLRGPGALPWPNTLPLVPSADRNSFSVVAELFDDSGEVFAVQRVRSGFVRREHHVLDIFFQDQCMEVLCTPTTTCAGGACVPSERAPDEGEGESRADRQPGACAGEFCYEHPRPGPFFHAGACVGDGPEPLELVVGSNLALRREGDVWLREELPARSPLEDVECWSERAIAVGDEGLILARDAQGEWSAEASGVEARLRQIAGVRPEDAWVVGDGGAVLRRAADGWQALDAGTTRNLADVYSPRRDEAWIAAGPAVLHYADGAWESVAAPGLGALGVAGRSGELLALGQVEGSSGGHVYRREGGAWVPLTGSYLGAGAIDVHESGAVAAGGVRGAELMRAAGREFELVDPGEGHNITSVAVGADRALFVGSRFLARWGPDGRRVVEIVELSRETLRGVAHTPDGSSALAVGDAGTVLRRASVGVWRREPVLDAGAELGAPLFAVTATEAEWLIAGEGVLLERPFGDVPSFLVSRPAPGALRAFANDGRRVVVVGANGVVLERVGPGEWADFADPLPDAAEVSAAAWESPDVLVVGTAAGELWRHAGGWQRIAALGEPIGCLREGAGELLACGRSIYEVTATGATARGPALSGSIEDLLPGSTPTIMNGGGVWRLAGGIYESRFTGGALASSVGPSDVLFVGAGARVVRAEQ